MNPNHTGTVIHSTNEAVNHTGYMNLLALICQDLMLPGDTPESLDVGIEVVQTFIGQMNPSHASMLIMRTGLASGEPTNQAQTAQAHHVSRTTVSQVLSKTYYRLRERIEQTQVIRDQAGRIDDPISDLGLDQSAFRALVDKEVYSISGLVALTREDVSEMFVYTGVWAVSFRQIDQALAERGLRIRYAREDSNLIASLLLNTRTHNALRKADVLTIDQLCGMRPSQLLEIPNIGQGAIREIQEKLAKRGRHLRQ